MNKEKYLITGAAGFIGANLTRALIEQGKEVHPLVRSGSNLWRLENLPIDPDNFIFADVTDYSSLKSQIHRLQPSHVFHLVTYGVYRDQKDEEFIFSTNVLGTLNLLKASRDLDLAAFINTGSVYEYADLPGKRGEEITGTARNMYDAAKISTTALAQSFAQEHHLPICTIRLFTTYGPYEDGRRLIPRTILALLNDQRPSFSPDVIRDFVYINDVVDAYMKAADHPNLTGQIINIGSGKPTKISDIVREITEVIAPQIKPIETGHYQPPRDSRCWADISKARQILNWQPQTDLKTNLHQLIEWYKTNRHLYD